MIAAVLAFAAAQVGPLADLRVGEEGDLARVVLVCSARCSAAPAEGGPSSYRIEGLSDSVTVPTNGALIGSVTVVPDGATSVLTIDTVRPPRRVRMSRCEPDALCFDMDLSDRPPPPPPPNLGSIARGVEALEARGAPTVTLRAVLQAEAGESLDAASCEAAKTALLQDAWALDAFRTHALCLAAAGAPGEADGLLARLQSYAPDEELTRLRALLESRDTATRAP